MKELITTLNNEQGEIIISGRELYEFLEVPTAYTIWFKRMSEYGFIEGQDFLPKMLESIGGRPSLDHHIKLDMAKEIAMVQRSLRGKQARQYFLRLEKMWNSPEMVIKRAMDFQRQKIELLETQIQVDKRYTDFGRFVESSEVAISIGTFAKILFDKHKLNIGRNKLYIWLRNKGYLIKNGREKNNPKQQFIEQGLFKLIIEIVDCSYGNIPSYTTLLTGKGQLRITEELLNEFGEKNVFIANQRSTISEYAQKNLFSHCNEE